MSILMAMAMSSSLVSQGLCANQQNPLVVLEPIEANSSDVSYVGEALTRMLQTRLSSEGIDTVLFKKGQKDEQVISVADFILAGRVSKRANHFEALFELRLPKDNTLLKKWELRAPALGILAKDASLLSAKISDAIKNADELMVSNKASELVTNDVGSKKIKTDDEFAMARLHPDILVREKLEKDEIQEIEQQRRRQGGGVSPAGGVNSGYDSESFMPIPDVYDVSDDVSEEELAKQKQMEEVAKASGVSDEEEDDSSFMPVPDVYDPDDDEDAVEKPKTKVNTVQTDKNVKVGQSYQPSQAGVSSHQSSGEKGGSWYSWLWPFGHKDEQQQMVSQAKETRLQKENEEKDKEPVVVSSPENLPVPRPPVVQFDIPDPVPLDEALEKIENIKVEKKRDRGWFSWLWPWDEDDTEIEMNQSSALTSVPEKNLEVRQEPSLHTFDSGSKVDAGKDLDAGTQAAPSGSLSGTGSVEEDTSSLPKNIDTQKDLDTGPIWQWN